MLIVGASGRAAAASALRAGWQPAVVDLFADADTQALAACWPCPLESYPQGLISQCEAAPPGPFLITGGLENHPDVMQALCQTRTLYGSSAEAILCLRDPFAVRNALTQAGIPTPRLACSEEDLDSGIRWLAKPLRSSGGTGIHFASPGEGTSPMDHGRYYWQEYIPGEAFSAVFHSPGDRALLLGCTQQITGADWLHASGFKYCGNIGPIPGFERQAQQIADVLQDVFGPRGIWGFDFLVRDGEMLLIEVNPRYTASVEVFELAHGRSAFLTNCPFPAEAPYLIGKAIYYASRTFLFPTEGPWMPALAAARSVWELPPFADLPVAGSTVHAEHPVLTVFARGRSVAECLRGLQQAAHELDHYFGVRYRAGDESRYNVDHSR